MSETLYWRLHVLSKCLESSGRIDEHDMPDAYSTILDAMNAALAEPEPETVMWRVRRHDCPDYWIPFMHRPVDAYADPEREVQELVVKSAAPPAQTTCREPEQSEPVAWRPKLEHPIPYITGTPRPQDIANWCNHPCEGMRVEIEYAYAQTPRREPLTKEELLMQWRHFTVAAVEWCDYQDLYKHFAEILGIGGKE